VALIHQSVLAGLPTQIGQLGPKTQGQGRRPDFQGPRGIRFAIAPGSALHRKPPDWVMAVELTETERLWARKAAKIDPLWLEQVVPELLRFEYANPRWEAKGARVVATEKVLLQGLTLNPGRTRGYQRVDPIKCREIFLESALVENDWGYAFAFQERNRRWLERLGEARHKTRRPDLEFGPDQLYQFFAERVPEEICSGADFARWWKRAVEPEPHRLDLDSIPADELPFVAPTEENFPTAIDLAGVRVNLSYRYEPGSQSDGVKVHVPVSLLPQLRRSELAWHVPGVRAEVVLELLRTLPKAIRRQCQPMSDLAAKALLRIDPEISADQLPTALARAVFEVIGVSIGVEDLDPDRVPDHLRLNYQVEAEGAKLAESRDLANLRLTFESQAQRALASQTNGFERADLRTWPTEPIPRRLPLAAGPGLPEFGYPTLVAEGDQVALRVLATAAEQRAAMPAGLAGLLRRQLPSPLRAATAHLDGAAKLSLAGYRHGGAVQVLGDAVDCAVGELVRQWPEPVWDQVEFQRLQAWAAPRLVTLTRQALDTALTSLRLANEIDRLITDRSANPRLQAAAWADPRAQLAELTGTGFLRRVGFERLADLGRYLSALRQRVERLGANPTRDAESAAELAAAEATLADLSDRLRRAGRISEASTSELTWMLQELRVQLFAQQLGTRVPISRQRFERAVAAAALAAGLT
jgi:ATP-dependent helicase HrpA